MYHPATKDKLIDQAIADAFSHYYNTLYNLKEDTSIPQPSKSEIDDFLGEINLPIISPEQLYMLNAPFATQELIAVVSNLPSN